MARDSYTRYPRPILWLVRGSAEIPSFYLSKKPVTNVQFEAYDPEFRRSDCSPGDDDPATGLGFSQARGYCAWYAGVSQKPMRLPTEIEWEHACRGGTSARAFWGDDAGRAEDYVWDRQNAPEGPGRYESRRPNPSGLLVMLGGVWEWAGKDPGVLCGGSFRQHRDELHAGLRRTEPAAARPCDAGFRLARSFDGG